MKTPEVYKIIRQVIDPWCKARGFTRTQGTSRASWCKPYGDQFLVFWFQCSSDGWDPYAGSQFTVEFQIANRPVLGLGVNRKRLAQLLTEDQLELARCIQNEVIARLPEPPKSHYLQMGSGEVIEWYLKKFEPVHDFASARFSHSDAWFRYHEPEDVRRWASFVLEILPCALTAFAPQIIC